MFLTAFNCGIYSAGSDALVISQRSQIMSFSVDHHYIIKLIFLIYILRLPSISTGFEVSTCTSEVHKNAERLQPLDISCLTSHLKQEDHHC